MKEILQALLTDILTNPEIKSTREFYGTEKDTTVALEDVKSAWPKEFKPAVHGYKLVEVNRDPFVNQRRILGIRLDKFDLKQKKAELFNSPIEVCLFNAGGSANGAVFGGCSVYYSPKRIGQRWAVELLGVNDP